LSEFEYLELPPAKWGITKEKTFESNMGSLGDGYSLTGAIPFSGRDVFTLTISGISDLEFTEIWSIIKDSGGYKVFRWREFDWQDYKNYVFDREPSSLRQGENCWEIRVVLREIK
jgi:hypothetical protein